MNKYSKAVKTAATVGMSLAMVLSAVTPVNAALTESVCKVENFAAIQPVLNWLLDSKLEMSDLETSQFSETHITWTDGKDYNLYEIFVGANAEDFKARMSALKNAVDCADEDELEKVEYFYNAMKAYTEFKKGELKLDADLSDTDLEGYTENLRKYEVLISLNNDYVNNLNNIEKEEVYDAYFEAKDIMDDYDFDAVDVMKKYVKELKEEIKDFVETQTTEDKNLNKKSITKAELTAFIKGLKATDEYKAFKDEEEVVEEIFDELDSWFDEIADVVEAVNPKNDAYDALLDLQKDNDRDYSGKEIVDKMTMADFEVYEDFKENVVDVVWSMKTEEFAKRHYNDSEKSNFATVAEVNKILGLFSDTKEVSIYGTVELGYLATLQDDETGEFGWDVLAAHMEEVETNYDLINKELNKLVGKNLTVNDKEMILALDDAWDYLTVGAGKDNLTAAEAKVVRRAERTINELYESYRVKFGSLNNATGWINMGNGEYKYFEEDGTAPTKWVASGKNWYYVKDGVMLRNAWVAKDSKGDVWYYVGNDGAMVTNTTVDGCYINSYGAWTK